MAGGRLCLRLRQKARRDARECQQADNQQKLLGAVRQKGVPYINNAMAPQLVKAYGGLLAASAKRTKRLEERTERLCTAADRQIMRHDRISEEVAAIVQTPVSDDEASASISSLIGYLEGR